VNTSFRLTTVKVTRQKPFNHQVR